MIRQESALQCFHHHHYYSITHTQNTEKTDLKKTLVRRSLSKCLTPAILCNSSEIMGVNIHFVLHCTGTYRSTHIHTHRQTSLMCFKIEQGKNLKVIVLADVSIFILRRLTQYISRKKCIIFV